MSSDILLVENLGGLAARLRQRWPSDFVSRTPRTKQETIPVGSTLQKHSIIGSKQICSLIILVLSSYHNVVNGISSAPRPRFLHTQSNSGSWYRCLLQILKFFENPRLEMSWTLFREPKVSPGQLFRSQPGDWAVGQSKHLPLVRNSWLLKSQKYRFEAWQIFFSLPRSIPRLESPDCDNLKPSWKAEILCKCGGRRTSIMWWVA